MVALAARRPLFHSEADFQLALAWEIQTGQPDAQLRLEQRVALQPTVKLDLLIALDGRRYAVELKYPKSQLAAVVDGEPYQLSAGAPDAERYDVVKDITRVERLVDARVVDAGAVVVLTNSPGFWRTQQPGRISGDAQFRLDDGRVLTGTLEWGPTAGAGTRASREAPLELRGTYPLHWQPYSTVAGRELRYLLLAVERG